MLTFPTTLKKLLNRMTEKKQISDGDSRNNKLSRIQKSSFFVGSENRLEKINDFNDSKKIEKELDKIRLHLKNYLQLDNVSFLFGAGTSIHLGSESIQYIPSKLLDEFSTVENGKVIVELLTDKKIKKKEENDDIEYEGLDVQLEKLLNKLLNLSYLSNIPNLQISQSDDENGNEFEITSDSIQDLVEIIKKYIFKICDLDKITLDENSFFQTDEGELDDFKNACKEKMEDYGKHVFHKKLLKALLQRPLNLRRVNIFTTNNDLAFENAFDELGIHYIDGFTGHHKRAFRPEVYNYDLYFPGHTTEGQVRRVERVIRYFKLHGSISWVDTEKSSESPFGVEEKTIDYLRNNEEEQGDLLIYPSAKKTEYTLGFPYSELFRQFAATITQEQSVLFCVGYSFSDEHINDIIYQALSIPSFTLVIVDFKGTENEEIERLKNLDDPRIIIMEGPYLGDFKTFATDIIPSFQEMDSRQKIADTLEKLYSEDQEVSNE